MSGQGCLLKKVDCFLEGSSSFWLCSSRKNPYPPHGSSLEIPRGRGVFEANILKAKYKAKLEFPGGTGGGGGC